MNKKYIEKTKTVKNFISSLLAIALIFQPVVLSAATSSTLKDTHNNPLSGIPVYLVNNNFEFIEATQSTAAGEIILQNNAVEGYLLIQPNLSAVQISSDPVDYIGHYTYQPRWYKKPANVNLNITVPKAAAIVIKAYDQNSNLMRWKDFIEKGFYGYEQNFMYLTNMDDEAMPAVNYHMMDLYAFNYAAEDKKPYCLPSVLIDIDRIKDDANNPCAINMMFWENECGKLLLKADNMGAGFKLSDFSYDSNTNNYYKIIELNVELARTAVNNLIKKLSYYMENAADPAAVESSISNLSARIQNMISLSTEQLRAKEGDNILKDAVNLRDSLELETARNVINNPNSPRKGTLTINVKDAGSNPVEGCDITVNQTSHDFLFGGFVGLFYDGSSNDTKTDRIYTMAKNAGFNLVPLLMGWANTKNIGEIQNGQTPAENIDYFYGISHLKYDPNFEFKLKAHASVWMNDIHYDNWYVALPQNMLTQDYTTVKNENISYLNNNLLANFSNSFDIWEVINEPAQANVINMPTYGNNGMIDTVRDAADIIKNNVSEVLINSAHEFNYGTKYNFYDVDNKPLIDKYLYTFSDFLKMAKIDEYGNALEKVNIIGLQFYPGITIRDLATQQEVSYGPAMTPSWLVDTVNRYHNNFNKKIHITEFSIPSYVSESKAGYWKSEWTEQLQADYAERIYTLMFANPNVESLVWWEIFDENTSFIANAGIIASDETPKLAYNKIKNLIKTEWTTNVSAQTDINGQAIINGFAGDYIITATNPLTGETVSVNAHINEGSAAEINIEVSGNSVPDEKYSLNINYDTSEGNVIVNPVKESYDSNENVTIEAVDSDAYRFSHWSGDVESQENPLQITMTNNKTITANFALKTYIITPEAGAGGAMVPEGPVSVNHGFSESFYIAANTGYHIKDVLVDNISVGAVGEYTFTNVTQNHSIKSVFEINTYTVSATSQSTGSISPSGTITVNYNTSKQFTITPNSGYVVSDVIVDGASKGAITTYTFNNIKANHSIEARFKTKTKSGGCG